MLGKLLKYEFRATARLFLTFYLALIVFALLNAFFSTELLVKLEGSLVHLHLAGAPGLLYLILRLLYFALVVGVMVMTLLVMFQRFYQSLLGDEGYLMFTLPVAPWQHIVSKLLTALVWTVASSLLALLSVLIITTKVNLRLAWPGLSSAIGALLHNFGLAGLFLLPAITLAAAIAGILMTYAAITLGHLSTRHRMAATIGWFFAFQLAFIGLMIALLALLLPGLIEKYDSATTPALFFQQLALQFFLLPSLALGALSFWLTNFILNRRLNLE